jgi:hypothetical protein
LFESVVASLVSAQNVEIILNLEFALLSFQRWSSQGFKKSLKRLEKGVSCIKRSERLEKGVSCIKRSVI